eukprot:scaffold83812_cov53-Phaeocystis_antarctica.AAC.2
MDNRRLPQACEECDDASACCVNCRKVAGAGCDVPSACCTGECCNTDTCEFEPPTTSCGTDMKGWCQEGVCEETSICASFGGWEVDTQSCPIFNDQQCIARCYSSSNGLCNIDP